MRARVAVVMTGQVRDTFTSTPQESVYMTRSPRELFPESRPLRVLRVPEISLKSENRCRRYRERFLRRWHVRTHTYVMYVRA